ncbi:MAG TPA: DUF503 domain-containing protein [Acidimicrobiales bacterium]
MRHRPVRLPGPQRGRRHRDLRGAGDPTHVAALSVELHLPQSRSLKAKRAIVKPIVEGARHRYAVAAAEVDHQDKWQRCQLGIAAVAGSAGHVADVLDQVERWVWSFPDVEVLSMERRWLDGGS